MKHILALIVGLLLGGIVAASLIYFNPMLAGDPQPKPTDPWNLSYSFTGASTLLLTHNEQIALPEVPPDVADLWESGIDGMILNALALTGDTGLIEAVATRVSVPSAKTNLLTEGVLVDDYWLLTVPGAGSLFVHSLNNQWDLVKDTLVRVDLLGQDWPGPIEYDPTRGPETRGSGSIVGLSGQFSGQKGTALERLALDRYDVRGFEQLRGELALVVE